MKDTPVGTLVEGGTINGFQQVPTKLVFHYAQNSITGRFQEYVSPFVLNISYFTKAKEVPIHKIRKVPIRYMIMDQDSVCPEEAIKPFMEQVKTSDGVVHFDQEHTYPDGAND